MVPIGGVIWNPVLGVISGPVETTLSETHILAMKAVMISGAYVSGWEAFHDLLVVLWPAHWGFLEVKKDVLGDPVLVGDHTG